MTKVSSESHAGELGVSFMKLICGIEKVIFRPIELFDVGIDGFIEPQVENIATGAFIGVQIKSGPSFKRDGAGKYVFKSDKAHFEYWLRCTLPVVGVVYDPESDKAVWTNLSDYADKALTENGPWSIRLSFENDELNTKTLSQLISSAESTRISRKFENSISAVISQREKSGSRTKNNVDGNLAWEEIFETFLSLVHDEWTVADAGYWLSWNFPSDKHDPRYVYALTRMAKVNDVQLTKIISAMAGVMEDNAEPVAEHLCYMLSYVPNFVKRLEKALANSQIRKESIWVAIQAIEFIGKYPRQDLWKMYCA